MIISGHQPNYLPWLGYFHKMLSCDLFVILDDVLHSRKSYFNRNLIKSPEGTRMLVVPLIRKKALIKDAFIFNDAKWNQKHWRTLHTCYAKAPYWKEYECLITSIYSNPGDKLIDLNLRLINVIRDLLEIKTPMVFSSDYPEIPGNKGDKIINICKYFGAKIYLSGTGAHTYNDEEEFKRNNLHLVYQVFEHPVYPQQWDNFIPAMSAIDLLFNCGPKSKNYLSKQSIL